MRTYPLVAACLILVGCGRQAENHREVLGKLDAMQSQLASKNAAPVRWAYANKREIETAVYQMSRDKMEAAKSAEALSPEVEEKIRQYEALESELMQKRMERMRLRFAPEPPSGERPETAEAYEALTKKVAEAKEPVASIVDRRNRQAAQYREQYSVTRLTAEYVKGRYDLVVDSNEKVLYRSAGEVPDITEGLITFLSEKAKP